MAQGSDSAWMAKALKLAQRGLYTASPNPRVGCVLVRDGRIVGEGFHARAGEPHAEIHALNAAGENAKGATAYVTLEPCNHYGRTPPCADALIEAGIIRVVAAMQDPNPLVAGQGLNKLRAAGLAVECGLMEEAARELNIGFVSRMTRGLPWVASKIAMSLDARTALHNGVSQWITGEAARRDVQRLRARSCAILTSSGTVLADDPQLNVRDESIGAGGRVRQPLRVVMDSHLRIPLGAKVLQGESALIYTAKQNADRISALEARGAKVAVLPDGNARVDLTSALRDLAARGCNEVLVEAGSELNGALLMAGLVDELILYIAPQLLGDMARGMAALGELTALDERIELTWRDVRQVGRDLRVTARVKGDH